MNEPVQTGFDESIYSYGQCLQAARRALNLSVAEVARELRLSAILIEALEAEDYDKLPAPIYIIGYLKNYTRLLNIPVEPLLSALAKVDVEVPPLISDVARTPAPTYNVIIFRCVGIGLAVLLLAGFIAWLQTQDFDFQLGGKGANKDTIVSRALETPLPAVADDDVSDKNAQAKVAENPVSAGKSADKSRAPDVKARQADKVAIETGSAKDDSIIANQDIRVIDKNLVTLELAYSEDCWSEVFDSAGRKLVFDLVRAGRTRTVAGTPPFAIFLGNARAVEIKYNGEPYDISRHVRGKLARFQLGSAADIENKDE